MARRTLGIYGEAPGRTPVRRAMRRMGVAALVLLLLLLGLAVVAAVGVDIGAVALAIGIVLAVLPVPLYIMLALWVDRFEPEPFGVLASAFLWGATGAVFIAFVLNTIGTLIVDDQLGSTAAEIYGGSISAPVVEETAKAAIIWLIYWRRRAEFDGIVDGIVYAIMVGIGFAMVENIIYYGQGAVELGITGALATFILRGLMSPFAHPLFTSMTGIGFGIASRSPRRWVRIVAPLVGLFFAIVLHSLWNTAATTGLFFGVYLLIMVPLAVVLLIIIWIARYREGQIIGKSLQPYVGVGLLTEAEVEQLSKGPTRRATEKWVKLRYGNDARDRLRRFYEAATELAYLRHRMERGLQLPKGADAAEIEKRLMARVHELRHELGAMWTAAQRAY
jgi:RsiW-degrading membrane proteinase PrsW (M82 family)